MAFYIGEKGTILDRIIDIWSGWYGYSHCELVFSDGMSFSASPREGKVRFKRIDYDDKWVIRDLPFSYEMEDVIRGRCREYLGKSYDYIGVLLYYGLFTDIYDKKKWWCSEICAKLIGMDDYHITPNQLAKRLNVKSQWDK